jgi:hypothetical protein
MFTVGKREIKPTLSISSSNLSFSTASSPSQGSPIKINVLYVLYAEVLISNSTDIKFGRRRKRKNANKTFVGKPKGTKHLLRRKNRSNDNIKVNLKEMRGGGVN